MRNWNLGCQNLLSQGRAAIMCFMACLCANVAHASSPILEQSYSSGVSNGWELVERYRTDVSAIAPEAFPPDGRGNQTGQRATFFDSAQPHANLFLLYHMPGWDSNPNGTPILLVHGATQNADQAWANPADPSGACGRQLCPSTGLAQELVAQGYRVFAIGFPHSNGDGYYWAEQIGDALEIIRNKTGQSHVDIIAWSKGTFNSRMYVSSLRQSWGQGYNNDVRRMILIGGPNNGFDWSFRHGTFGSVPVLPGCGGVVNGPAVHTWMYCFFVWQYAPQWDHNSSYFPGTKQMLKRWDHVYSPALFEADAFSTYHGGWGLYSYAPGIDAYLPGSLVDALHAQSTPNSIRVHMLCGNQNDIPLLHNEHTGPSDGVIFRDSCLDTTGIPNVGGTAVIQANHLESGWHSSAISQVLAWLAAP